MDTHFKWTDRGFRFAITSAIIMIVALLIKHYSSTDELLFTSWMPLTAIALSILCFISELLAHKNDISVTKSKRRIYLAAIQTFFCIGVFVTYFVLNLRFPS